MLSFLASDTADTRNDPCDPYPVLDAPHVRYRPFLRDPADSDFVFRISCMYHQAGHEWGVTQRRDPSALDQVSDLWLVACASDPQAMHLSSVLSQPGLVPRTPSCTFGLGLICMRMLALARVPK